MNPLQLAAFSSFFLLQSTNGFATSSHTVIRDATVQIKSSNDVNQMESRENPGRRGFLAAAAISFGGALLPSIPAFADDDASTATLHILNYPIDGKCGEAKVPENGVFFAKTFGKLEDGSCAAEGYTVDEGTANGTGEKDQKRTYSVYGK